MSLGPGPSGTCYCGCHRMGWTWVVPSQQPHKCPVCDGAGKLNKPPEVAGDQLNWSSSLTGPWPCHACNGTGVLWR